MSSDTRSIRLITFARVEFLMFLQENSFPLNKKKQSSLRLLKIETRTEIASR